MSPVEDIFVPFPPKTGTNMLRPRPPPKSLNRSQNPVWLLVLSRSLFMLKLKPSLQISIQHFGNNNDFIVTKCYSSAISCLAILYSNSYCLVRILAERSAGS